MPHPALPVAKESQVQEALVLLGALVPRERLVLLATKESQVQEAPVLRDAREPRERRVLLASKETLDRKATRDSREKKEIKETLDRKAIPGRIRPPQWRERLRRQGLRPRRLWRRRSQLLSRRPQNRAPLALRAIRVRPVPHPPSKDPLGKQGNPILVPRAVPARLALLVRRALLAHLDPPIPNY